MKERYSNEGVYGKEVPYSQRIGLELQEVLLSLDSDNQTFQRIKETASVFAKDTSDTHEQRKATLEAYSIQMFGEPLEEALKNARESVILFRPAGEIPKSLIITSGSPFSNSIATEKGSLESNGHIVDMPGAIEGRDTRSARDGDVALISTDAGLKMARSQQNVRLINLAEEVVFRSKSKVIKGSDVYYKADGLMLLTITNPNSPVLLDLIQTCKEDPIVTPYILDNENLLVLYWLSKRAGNVKLRVNANSLEVSENLTRKGIKYPSPHEAVHLPFKNNPYEMQIEEWKLSESSKDLNFYPDTIPGYYVKRGESLAGFSSEIWLALALMSTRYDFTEVWIKPDRGTDGGGQKSIKLNPLRPKESQSLIQDLRKNRLNEAVIHYQNLQNKKAIETNIKEMKEFGGDWVIEALTHYFDLSKAFGDPRIKLTSTPSVHLIRGRARPTITLQFLDGNQWGGNFICDRKNWIKIVDSIEDIRITKNPKLRDDLKNSYDIMPTLIDKYSRAVNQSNKFNGGQVRGGADLAIATLGGKFDSTKLVIGIQDYNARANGGETAYGIYDQAKSKYGDSATIATRNITPRVDFDVFDQRLNDVVLKTNQKFGTNILAERVRLVGVSAGWGQIAFIGTDGMEIVRDIFKVEEILRDERLIK